ncbi:MAG: FAD-dependent monooxygenase [Actinomycetota bacterium]
MTVAAEVDVLVVGGGPVGLAAAIEARLRGLSVAVVEQRQGRVDKACGEGLMPGALPALARLGVDPPGFALRGVSYRAAGFRADHRFATGVGRGVRRTALHDALAERARSLGVVVVRGKVDALEQDSRSVTAAGIRARYLVAADGLHSTVRRLSGLERPIAARGRRYGVRRHFRIEPASDLIEVYWTPKAEVYVTPVGGGVVGIAALGRQGLDFDTVLAGIPALAALVAGSEPASALRGAGPFRQGTTRRSLGRVLLVGDASGYVDAITGEGIRVGLAQAEAAIASISRDDPQGYEREWMLRTQDFRILTAGLVAAANSPFRGAIAPAASALPRVFGAVVERLAR